MNTKPLTETQILNRLAYYASSGVSAGAVPIANACYWLTRCNEDEAVIARWSEILDTFSRMFRAAYPSGLRILASRSGAPGAIRTYLPSLIAPLPLWRAAKAKVLDGSAKIEVPPPIPPNEQATPTRIRLIGGTAGEPDLTDEDDSLLSAAKPSPSNTLTPPTSQPRSEVTAPAFFQEVTVRPAKVTQQQSAAPTLIDATALEAAEHETAEVDSMLAAMLGADGDTPKSNNNPSR